MKWSSAVILFCILMLANAPVFSRTIARLQLRVNDQDSWSFTQSVFHSFGHGQYVLQIYDREEPFENSKANERFELYLGSSLDWKDNKTPFGVVARAQKWTDFEPIYAGGVMLDLNKIPKLGNWLSASNSKTFVQVFAKTEEEQLGYGEVLHYYQINKLFGSKTYVRGYNILHTRSEALGGDIFQSFADLIYPVHPHWDVYYRWSYVSEDTQQLGDKGSTSSIGFRFNF